MAKKQKSFDEQLARLREIHTSLENGNQPIEEMLISYEEGMKLVAELQSYLETTEQRVVDITKRYSSHTEESEEDEDEPEDEE